MSVFAKVEELLDEYAPELCYPACASDCVLRSEADHRVANHLAMLSSYVRLKAGEFDLPAGPPSRAAAQLFAQSVDGQIRAVARLHRLLISGQPSGPLELVSVIHEICAPFISGMDRRIALVEDVPGDCEILPDQVLPVSQIISEAITNAIKYAYAGGETGVVMVRAGLQPGEGVWIEVGDSGRGLPAGFDPDGDGGFGFHLMRGLSRSMRAGLVFDSDGRGLRTRLTLPPAPSPYGSPTAP